MEAVVKNTVSACLVLAFGIAPAFAGSLDPPADPVVAPPPPVSGDWAGPYVGVQLGFADFDLDTVVTPAGAAPIPTTFSDDGFRFGVHAGYNWDRGALVYGIEGDIDFPDISLGATDVDNIARIRLRLGLDANRAFVYTTAGAAHINGSGGGISLSDWGWVAGGGVDFKLNEKWLLGADALYHDFDVSPTTDVDGMTYRLRASFRF